MIRKLLKGQKGMTALETLVMIAIAGVLTTALASMGYNVLRVSSSNHAHVTADDTLEQAARSISEDSQAAQSTDLVVGANPVSSVTLSWIDPVNGDNHAIVYFLSANNLRRRESVNGVVQTETTKAGYVTGVAFSQPANKTRLVKLSLTSSGGGVLSETRVYYVYLRSTD